MQFPVHKVIITGTGRAGTTFLVRLFTELGLDTGFTPHDWRRAYHPHSHAGLESDVLSPQAPYIVKNPGLCETLPDVLATGLFVVDHAIVPIRELEAAALSRVSVGGHDASVPGGLWRTADPAAQKGVLAELFHNLVHTLLLHDIPHTFLLFPRMVKDADYAFRKLQPVLGGIERARFQAAFEKVAEPDLVHSFQESPPTLHECRNTAAATAYVRACRRRETRHRMRRVVRASLAATAVVALALGTRGLLHERRRLAQLYYPAAQTMGTDSKPAP